MPEHDETSNAVALRRRSTSPEVEPPVPERVTSHIAELRDRVDQSSLEAIAEIDEALSIHPMPPR